jgi:hypothetical protein
MTGRVIDFRRDEATGRVSATLEIPQPVYGSQGQPNCVTQLCGDVEVLRHWSWTQGEAWEARGRLIDAGWLARVLGAPAFISIGI